MGSAIISDIVRGLIGILRGDDGRMYFQMLSHDLKALELQRLKAKAAKIMDELGISATRRVQGLGVRQREQLLEALTK